MDSPNSKHSSSQTCILQAADLLYPVIERKPSSRVLPCLGAHSHRWVRRLPQSLGLERKGKVGSGWGSVGWEWGLEGGWSSSHPYRVLAGWSCSSSGEPSQTAGLHRWWPQPWSRAPLLPLAPLLVRQRGAAPAPRPPQTVRLCVASVTDGFTPCRVTSSHKRGRYEPMSDRWAQWSKWHPWALGRGTGEGRLRPRAQGQSGGLREPVLRPGLASCPGPPSLIPDLPWQCWAPATHPGHLICPTLLSWLPSPWTFYMQSELFCAQLTTEGLLITAPGWGSTLPSDWGLLVWNPSSPSSWDSQHIWVPAGDPSSIPGLGRSAGEGIGYPLQYSWGSLVVQLVKNLLAMRKTWVPSLCWEDSPGEGKGYLLQYSGLENSMNGIVHGVTKSQTRLSNFHFHWVPGMGFPYLVGIFSPLVWGLSGWAWLPFCCRPAELPGIPHLGKSSLQAPPGGVAALRRMQGTWDQTASPV